MYAIVNIADQQMKVQVKDSLYTRRLNNAVGDTVTFDQILLLEDNKKITVGTPTIADVQVVAKIVAHVKADKIIVFKKKRRKGYKKTQGHRQGLTKICIEKIITP